jgi:hypothetical protein
MRSSIYLCPLVLCPEPMYVVKVYSTASNTKYSQCSRCIRRHYGHVPTESFFNILEVRHRISAAARRLSYSKRITNSYFQVHSHSHKAGHHLSRSPKTNM